MKPVIIVCYIDQPLYEIFHNSAIKTHRGVDVFTVQATTNLIQREITDLLLEANDQYVSRHPALGEHSLVNFGYAETDPSFFDTLKEL